MSLSVGKIERTKPMKPKTYIHKATEKRGRLVDPSEDDSNDPMARTNPRQPRTTSEVPLADYERLFADWKAARARIIELEHENNHLRNLRTE